MREKHFKDFNEVIEQGGLSKCLEWSAFTKPKTEEQT